MYGTLTSFLLICVTITVQSFTIPDTVTPCKRQDIVCLTKITNFLYQATVDGDAALGIESSDPMHQELIEGNLSIIKYKLFNTTIAGGKKCQVSSTKIAPNDTNLLLEIDCPEFSMVGDYEVDGRLIVFPVQGKGPYRLDGRGYHTSVDAEIKVLRGKDGKSYWSIKQFKVVPVLRGGMELDLQNLFNGKKELAGPVLKFIKEQWKEVAELLQGPTFNAIMKKLIKNFNKSLKHVPIDRLVRP